MTESPESTPSDAASSPAPPAPGEQRRLARPPGERYLAAEAAASAAPREDPNASVARGVALALVVALLGALAIVVLGAIVTVTTGLIVVAGLVGFGVALGLRWGAGARLAGGRRVGLAVGLTIAAIALAQVGIWQYARAEGGVLPLIDYLAEVFGPLVVVEFLVGALVASVAAR